ncbi:putative transcriptional regulator, TetR family protein [Mycolicibacterium madagascariense]|uniref:Putative transcriptional regulator, TetR family protein n=1 Tax=Mycolicibacterium madagascariense TaxID=212765 RepID=A0A7I7XLE7_9MYCO|nr:TetR/AcrR family transcriptional regulator [Mycolicibacterium madagascariense]MCV7012369.1 TetR/AcrR family transcriptional regulator [Mycolicibacterium madagascariense]BBZ30044.1 putative transcriptional regulator, TetR family protein [Mycolicibacterium madagascariense]
MPSEVVHAALRSAERLGRDVADVPIVAVAHALGVSRSTLLRQLGGSRAALDDAVRDLGVDPGGRPPVRLRAVDAAAALIGAGGVAAATLEAVAARADCSMPSLYATFGSRDALLEAVYDRYIPPLDVTTLLGDPTATGLRETVRRVYRGLAELCSREPRVLSAVLTETLARPAGPGAGVLIEHGALRMIAIIGAWLDDEVKGGRLRDLPGPVLIQQFISPVLVHTVMRPGLSNFPHVTLLDLDASCDLFADAFLGGAAVPETPGA